MQLVFPLLLSACPLQHIFLRNTASILRAFAILDIATPSSVKSSKVYGLASGRLMALLP